MTWLVCILVGAVVGWIGRAISEVSPKHRQFRDAPAWVPDRDVFLGPYEMGAYNASGACVEILDAGREVCMRIYAKDVPQKDFRQMVATRRAANIITNLNRRASTTTTHGKTAH